MKIKKILLIKMLKTIVLKEKSTKPVVTECRSYNKRSFLTNNYNYGDSKVPY
jgi:hypothetical protein